MQQDQTFKMYSTRWSGLPATFFGSVFLIVSIAVLLGGKAGGPLQAVGLAAVAFCSAFVSLYGLYFVLTPIPLLRVDGSGLSYQDFPLVVRSVRWEDVNRVRAFKRREHVRGGYSRRPELTLDITLKPQAAAVTPHGGPGGLTWTFSGGGGFIWTFSGGDLRVPPEEIVRHIRRFHGVDYQDQYNDLR